MPESDRITTRMPPALIDAVDDAVESGRYPSRSEAVRAAVRQQFDAE